MQVALDCVFILSSTEKTAAAQPFYQAITMQDL